MVHRCNTDGIVAALASPLPAGRVSLCSALAGERKRNKDEPEFELADTGIFEEDRYWQIMADYAKASPDDVCMRISVRNAGPDPAELHVLPTLWFRNRWSWGVASHGPSSVPLLMTRGRAE